MEMILWLLWILPFGVLLAAFLHAKKNLADDYMVVVKYPNKTVEKGPFCLAEVQGYMNGNPYAVSYHRIKKGK